MPPLLSRTLISFLLVLMAGCNATTARIAKFGIPVLAADSGNLIVNPGFESGNTGWVETSLGGYDIITRSLYTSPHTGNWYAWLGGYDNGNDVLYQDITIPAAAQQATFQFWYSAYTDETSTTTAYDFANVRFVHPITGATLMDLGSSSNLGASTDWVQSKVWDVTSLKGSTVRLRIAATNDEFAPTSFFFDDISLAVTSTVTPPATCASCTIRPGNNFFPHAGSGPGAAGNGQVAVSAPGGTAWTAVSNASWLSIVSGASGSGNGTVFFSVAANSGAQRVGTLNIGGKTFTVTQFGPPPPASIAPIVEYHNWAQDDYFITADPAEQQWLDAIALAGSVWSRTGMTFNSGGSSPVYRFIYDSSTDTNTHFYTMSTSEQSGLLANYPMWRLESPVAFYMTAANANQTCPAGTVPVYRAANLQTGSHRFTTSQNAIAEVLARGWVNEGVAFCAPPSSSPSCSFGISPTAISVGAGGAGGTVAVTATSGCPWTAVSSATWITLTSGASGSGNGSVGYSVAANAGAGRAGTIAIAGQVFTVTQAGATGGSAFQQEVIGYVDKVLAPFDVLNGDQITQLLTSAVGALLTPGSTCPVVVSTPSLQDLTSFPSSLTISADYGSGCTDQTMTTPASMAGSVVLSATNLVFTDTAISGTASLSLNNVKVNGVLVANGALQATFNIGMNSTTQTYTGQVALTLTNLQLAKGFGITGTASLNLNSAGTSVLSANLTTSPNSVTIILNNVSVRVPATGRLVFNTAGASTVGAYTLGLINLTVDTGVCQTGPSSGSMSFTNGGQTGTVTFDSTCTYQYAGP